MTRVRKLSVAFVVVALGSAAVLIAVRHAPRTPRQASERETAGASTPAVTGWRGDGTGSYPAASPPLHWSPSENILWRTALPGPSNATAVVANDRIFVTAEPDWLIAVRAADGQILWKQEVTVLDALSPEEREKASRIQRETQGLPEKLRAVDMEIALSRRQRREHPGTRALSVRIAELEEERTDLRAKLDRWAPYGPPPDWPIVGNTSATPVTDGHSVYVVYGTFVVAAFSLDGTRQWARYFDHSERRRLLSTELEVGGSPLLFGGRLIVELVDLYSLDPATGAQIWKGPVSEHFGTPLGTSAGTTPVIITPAGDVVRASDGTVLAKGDAAQHWQQPVVSGSLLILAGVSYVHGERDSSAEAFDLTHPLSDASFRQPVWHRALEGNDYRASPIVVGPYVIAVDEVGHLTALDVSTGSVVATGDERMSSVSSSPAFAGDHIFISGEDGQTTVLESKPPFGEVARNNLPAESESMRASLAFAGSRIYARTGGWLYCFSAERPRQ
jgi:outer membrane protein assembly factor BamB